MTVGTLCTRIVATASAEETVRAAARRMAEHNVGTLVVLAPEAGGKPAGMLTDRDVAVRCVAADKDPDHTKVGAIMSAPVQTVQEQVSVEDAIAQMARGGTRRLIVVGEEGRLIGLLSLDDILDFLAEETGQIGRLLGKQQAHVSA